MRMHWDRNWLIVGNESVHAVEARLVEDLGLVRGDDFLVRHPGWFHDVNGKRQSNGSLTAFLFTGDGSAAVMAKMALE